MADRRRLDKLLHAEDSDPGCAAVQEILDVYVELELAGEDPTRVYPGAASHLESCPACRADHDGLLEAARRFGDAQSE
jgi:predicted anti-sigma-YlaC factor YlaD